MTDLRQVPLDEAATVLRLPVPAVEALLAAGYLAATRTDEGEQTVALSELKAWLARNTSAGGDDPDVDGLLAGVELTAEDPTLDASVLLAALESRSDAMAERAFDIFVTAFPEAAEWAARRRERFVEQARDRFSAIIAVAGQGSAVDDELLDDLSTVGAAAAQSGSTLPEILLVLRISRDLVVQTAVDLADARGRHGGLALSLLLTQVLPAMDRLTDSVARGYWSEVVRREEESWARYEHVVEHSSDGVYEIDVDGILTYANPSLAVILGHDHGTLEGRPLDEVFVSAIPGKDADAFGGRSDGEWLDIRVRRTDGVVRHLQVRVDERIHHGGLVGYDGVVRDVTAGHTLEDHKNLFLERVTQELRQPVTTILGLGITVGTYADELTTERMRQIGHTIHQQAERIARLTDDLFDISRLDAKALLLNLRSVELQSTVADALGLVDLADNVSVKVPTDLVVRADKRRLEQVVAHLVENALLHGGQPIVVTGSGNGDSAELRVIDHGDGLAADATADLFDHPLPGSSRRRGSQGGFGLPLARGLVEAMGGRIEHEPNPAGGAVFVVTLPRSR